MPYNLLREKWLPVKRASGAFDWIAPRQISEADDPPIAFAWGRPDFDCASREFMIGLMATAMAPEDRDDWRDKLDNPPSPEVLRYNFAPLDPAFDLSGDGPLFMQDPDPLETAKQVPVRRLCMDAPGEGTEKDNADLWFKRDSMDAMCPAAAAIALYFLQAHAPAGGPGYRTGLRGGGPVVSLVNPGGSLWRLLWANVETAGEIEGRRTGNGANAMPWMEDGPRPGDGAVSQDDVHPLHVYWGMPRRVRLEFNDVAGVCAVTGLETKPEWTVDTFRHKSRGIDYKTETFRHPLTPYYRDGKARVWRPRHPGAGELCFRDWPGLCVRAEDGRARARAAAVSGWPDGEPAGILACGYETRQAKALAWVERDLPLLGDSEPEVEFASRAARGAEKMADILARCVAGYRTGDPSGVPDALGGQFRREMFRDAEDMFLAGIGEIAETGCPAVPVLEAFRRAAGEMLVVERMWNRHAPLDFDRMDRWTEWLSNLRFDIEGRGTAGGYLMEALGLPVPGAAAEEEADAAV